jgi:hypothetical protein
VSRFPLGIVARIQSDERSSAPLQYGSVSARHYYLDKCEVNNYIHLPVYRGWEVVKARISLVLNRSALSTRRIGFTELRKAPATARDGPGSGRTAFGTNRRCVHRCAEGTIPYAMSGTSCIPINVRVIHPEWLSRRWK